MTSFSAVTANPTLSKTRFLSGAQCHLRLWFDYHARHLAPEPDASLQQIFDTGHEVGDLACKRYPGGHFVAPDHRHMGEALAETRRVLEEGTAPALFEATFVHQGLLCRADVIERLPGGGWRLIEVKSTTRLKDVFVLDTAFQLCVLRGAGLDVREAAVMTLDRSYVYDGKRLDLDALFKLHDVFEQAEAFLDTVDWQAREMQALIARAEPPDILTGDHCFTPYECPYHGHCARDHVDPDHGISELPWLRHPRRSQLNEAGIEEIRDIPEDFPLSGLQRIVRRAVREQQSVVHGDIASRLAALESPVYYLDFETFAPAIPRFDGTSPYDSVPFLFSVHAERNGGAPAHVDYLHEQDDDPRPRIADRLIDALGTEGSICMYSPYERTVLNSLAAALPERAAELNAIATRLFDLHPVIRNTYYHPEFRGSFSIKSVLPVLVPGMGYDDLEIPDGQAASVSYMQALKNSDSRQRQQTFENLRAYCERDTLAMVRLREALESLRP